MEVMFSTTLGPVLAKAELLSPHAVAPIGLQPFRFTALNRVELQTLRAAIASCLKHSRAGHLCPPIGTSMGVPSGQAVSPK